LHLFGKIGLVFLASGIAIDGYLSVLWFLGERPIGDRPLLSLGTLLIVVGLQTFLSGLIGELFVSLMAKQEIKTTIIRKVIDIEGSNEFND
jgi:hypothetical protein